MRKMFRLFRALPLILVAGAVVYLSIWMWIDNGDWTYIIARVSGMTEKHANNLSLIAIAIQSLFFTSDWFYNRIRAFLNRRLEKAKGLNRQIYLGYKAGVEFLMALPKRTILFSFYLLLTILENLGVIDSAKDYAVVIVFIIAVDRVTKIWPEEKRRMIAFRIRLHRVIISKYVSALSVSKRVLCRFQINLPLPFMPWLLSISFKTSSVSPARFWQTAFKPIPLSFARFYLV